MNLASSRAIIVVGSPNTGKTTLFNSLLDKDEQVVPSQSVEYQYLKKKDFEMIIEVYTSSLNALPQLMVTDRHYVVVFTIDLSSLLDPIEDVVQLLKLLQDKQNVHVVMVGTKLDAHLLLDKNQQKDILTVVQLVAKQNAIPILFTSQRHSIHQKALKSYLYTKCGSTNELQYDVEQFPPYLTTSQWTSKDQKLLDSSKMALTPKQNNSSTFTIENKLDLYCLKVKMQTDTVVANEQQEYQQLLQGGVMTSQVKWSDNFVLLQ